MPEMHHTQLPAVRPSRPPYIEAFERFTQGKQDQIEALVAYGLFISSDYDFSQKLPSWPPEAQIAQTYNRLLHETELKNTEAAAKKIVDDHREQLVREHEKKYLDGIFKDIEIRAVKLAHDSSTHHFWKGVLEAATGALVWSVFLIIATIVFQRIGIDVLEAYEKASGLKIEHIGKMPVTPPSPSLSPGQH
jgi:hypothetical protein